MLSPSRNLPFDQVLKSNTPTTMRSFEVIGSHFGTDKIHQHGYHRFYPIFLEKLRDQSICMLEIGTEENRSIKLWEEYFPNARIFGIDIESEFENERTKVFKGDQSDTEFLEQIVSKINEKTDLIIDDGSHHPDHQVITFCHLFQNLLKPGGIYIIEDIETSYWKKGVLYGNKIKRGRNHRKSIIRIFKLMIDRVNDEFVKKKSIFKSSPIPVDVQKQIGMISFQHNCIIIIKKDHNFIPFNDREYRTPKNL